MKIHRILGAGRRRGQGAVVLALCAAGMVGCAVSGLSAAAAEVESAPAAVSAAPSDAAPDAPFDLASYRGRVVLVEFWASWCAPCRDAIPWLGAMLSDYGPDGLVVIAVNVDQNRASADQFLTAVGGRDLELRYDPAGKLAERLHIGGMPTEIVFDRHGVERFRHTEFLLRQRVRYESELRRLLDEK
jgi:YD repeat-containing protein